MVLTQKQTHRSMEQNRESRNKPELILSNSSTAKEARVYNGEDSFFNK